MVSDPQESLGSAEVMNSLLIEKRFKNACRLALAFDIYRYLISNTKGREDGAEKALRHERMCSFYVSVFYGLEDQDQARVNHEDQYQMVHDKTQELTSYLDEAVGFPLEDRHPDFDKLFPLFFEKFHQLATEVLS